MTGTKRPAAKHITRDNRDRRKALRPRLPGQTRRVAVGGSSQAHRSRLMEFMQRSRGRILRV
jgi:hypothetical protein